MRDGIVAAAAVTGFDIDYSGPTTMPTLLFLGDHTKADQLEFARSAARLGAMFHPALNWFISLAHTGDVIDRAIEIAHEALSTMSGPE